MSTATTLVSAAALAPTAAAHGFGQRYDLPVPLSLYLLGAGAAVVFSFVVAAVSLRSGTTGAAYPRFDLLGTRIGRILLSPPVARLLQILSVATFLLILCAGIIGSPNSSRNIAPVLVWVIWWVGVAYLSALAGPLWPLLNPWSSLHASAEALMQRIDPQARLSLDLPYPTRLGVWPGVLLFFAFAWMETSFHDPARPPYLASAILIYSIVTWAGMTLFGRDEWLRRGEAFSLAFGLLARFAPVETRVVGPGDACECPECSEIVGDCVNCHRCFRDAPRVARRINLRPIAAGLTGSSPVSSSMMAFVLLLLSTVTFDGFMDTPAWASIVVSYYSSFGSLSGVNTLGLVTFPLLFLALYLATSALMPILAGTRLGLLATARAFVMSLVPIALAYHLAHYLTYLLVQSQLLVPLISDPFGFGWNLFGTTDYAVDINVVGARFSWYVAVIAIVSGHVAAVWIAHIVALRLFDGHRAALRSQLPMLVLMVLYTAVSLWILAQPIVEAVPPA
jgi:hypothetical protein